MATLQFTNFSRHRKPALVFTLTGVPSVEGAHLPALPKNYDHYLSTE